MKLDVEIYRRLRDFTLDLSFSAGEGCLGILGASGCGKSMTLKSIAGIIRPDRGRIVLSGEEDSVLFDAEKSICVPPQKRQVGYLFQHYALFPNMTVEENILVGLEGREAAEKRKGKKHRFGEGLGKEKRGQRLGELVEQFRLHGLEKHYPGQLSGGQQQRTALARIFAYEPAVLLLDEPFSAMDSFLREGLRLELAGVLKRFSGISILVTHDRDEAFWLCSHLLLMDKGKVLAAGKTREVFRQPKFCSAARLTGCRNISRIQRLGAHRVRALDWNGLELVTEDAVEERHSAVGIRAHDLKEVPDTQVKAWEDKAGGNLIPVGKASVSEMPFAWYITLENGLWWKKEKEMNARGIAGMLPGWLRVEPSAVLLLEGE